MSFLSKIVAKILGITWPPAREKALEESHRQLLFGGQQLGDELAAINTDLSKIRRHLEQQDSASESGA